MSEYEKYTEKMLWNEVKSLESQLALKDKRIEELEGALRELQPYFEGEHFHDHPHCVMIRNVLHKEGKG